jgi:hypothetical protein
MGSLLMPKKSARHTQRPLHVLCQKLHHHGLHRSVKLVDLLCSITFSKFGNGIWKGKAHRLTLNWKEDKIQKYELILHTVDHLHASVTRALLNNAIAKVPKL